MDVCVVVGCGGHDTLGAVLIHGQQHIIDRLHAIQAQMDRIEHDEEHTMADVDQLAADFDTFKTDVDTAVSELKTELADALANQGGIPPAVQDKLDALDATIEAADTSLTAAPAPEPPPAPTPPAGP